MSKKQKSNIFFYDDDDDDSFIESYNEKSEMNVNEKSEKNGNTILNISSISSKPLIPTTSIFTEAIQTLRKKMEINDNESEIINDYEKMEINDNDDNTILNISFERIIKVYRLR